MAGKKISAREFNINKLLTDAVNMGASDIHIIADCPPAVRINGDIMYLEDYSPLPEDIIVYALKEIVPETNTVRNYISKMETTNDFDFSYEIKGVSRFRVNVCSRMYQKGMVIRTIPFDPPSIEKLHLPPAISTFADYNNGLILVTGPTGSGKSTTIASIIDLINRTKKKHIVSVEDPVEFAFQNKKCIFSQRQVGFDTANFQSGVKYALRQDPDIIFIGEIRDRETIDAALNAAETGHLVISTLHTNGAITTINRITSLYEPEQRAYLRQKLASCMRATLSQKLLPTIDGKSRRPACELLVFTPTIQDLIMKDEIESIYELVKNGSFDKMITLNASLYQLHKAGYISQEVALENSNRRNELSQMFRGIYYGVGNDN